jgi:hypothetical protein
LVVDNVVHLDYCPIKQQVVDIFNKSLMEEIFVHLYKIMGMFDPNLGAK